MRPPSGPTPTPLPITAETVDRGASLFGLNGCAFCHGANGEGNVGPRIAGTDLSLAAVRQQVRLPPPPHMPAFPPGLLSDDEITAIYAFLRSLGGG